MRNAEVVALRSVDITLDRTCAGAVICVNEGNEGQIHPVKHSVSILEVLSLLWVVLGLLVIDEATGVLRELVEGLDKGIPFGSSLGDCYDCWLEHETMTIERVANFTYI
jgi:hypothetical protein